LEINEKSIEKWGFIKIKESQKIKIETEKEIKEKKAEVKESEERLLTRENNTRKALKNKK
jgi:hypothetical protein